MNGLDTIKLLGNSGKREFLKGRPSPIFAFMHEVIESNLATKRDIKELEQKMTIKLGALIVVTIGILVALSNLQSPMVRQIESGIS